MSKEQLDSAIAVSVRNTEDQLYTQYSNQIMDIQNQLTYYKENEVFCTEQIADLRQQLEQTKQDSHQSLTIVPMNTTMNTNTSTTEISSGNLQPNQRLLLEEGKSAGVTVVDLHLFEELLAKYTQVS